MDDTVAEFVGITSADAGRAAHYLRLTDGNLEQAIQLYFDSPNLDFGDSAQPSAAPPTSSTHAAAEGLQPDDSGVIHIPSDDDDDMMDDDDLGSGLPSRSTVPSRPAAPAAQSSVEDDEAMARRLQEEMYAGGDAGGGIRAPMARTTETLVGPNANWGGDDMNAAITEQLLQRQNRRPPGRPGIFNQRPTGASIWEDTADSDARRRNLSAATGGASESTSKAGLLAEMYRPPFEIISRLSWDDARDEGKNDEKWMLVNVQDPAIFDCQVLNRDIWKNPEIKATIKENFLFMQYSKDDPRGASYINYYFHARDSQGAYPHIAIVDPRTGEQVKVWSGPPVPKPMEFLMQLHEFLDRYSLKADARNPVATRKPETKKVDVDRMTEKEMLEMAMQNSLANNTEGPRDDDPDALTKDTAKGKEKAVDEGTAEAANGAPEETSPFAQISSTNPHTEPTANPATTTRIQFRYSGGRVVRRFALSDPVRRIFEWLKATPIEGKEGVPFDIIFMGKNLMAVLDQTIADAGLKNGSTMVEFLEDDE